MVHPTKNNNLKTHFLFMFCWPYIKPGRWQLDAHFFYITRLFQSSTCFEQTRVHHQEVNYINTASDIFNLCKWPSGMQVEQFLLDLHTGRPLTESDYTRCCINTIDLLMMSMCFALAGNNLDALYHMLQNTVLCSWGWTKNCPKHVLLIGIWINPPYLWNYMTLSVDVTLLGAQVTNLRCSRHSS